MFGDRKCHGNRTMALNWKQFVISCLVIPLSGSTAGSIECPSMCHCREAPEPRENYFEYVYCRGEISDIRELDLPPKIGRLYLSGMSIQEIPPYFFLHQGYENLSDLHLTHNKIGRIRPEGFVGLVNLRSLDLSDNPIESFNVNSVLYNTQLTFLTLRRTNISIPSDKPLLSSNVVKLLDISENDIKELPPTVFSELPSLRVLNLSYNPLNFIDMKALDGLYFLKTLDIRHTGIRCNASWRKVVQWAVDKSVKLYGNPCERHLADDTLLETPAQSYSSVTHIESTTEPIASYAPDEESTDIPDSAIFLPTVNWVIWLAAAFGFALGMAITIGLSICVYACCCKRQESANDVVSASEEFQLVEPPILEISHPADEPPPYSSLFSSRYHKVLPTAPPRR